MPNDNPPLSLFLRVFTVVEVVVLVVAGVGLFFFGAALRPIWPWDVPPFNAAFIGAIYLASVPAIGLVALVGRWSPARVVLPMLLAFTGFGLSASLLNLNGFQFQRWAAWFWFFIYASLSLNSIIHLWLYRRWPPAQPIPTSPAWRYVLWAQGGLLVLYGLGQFVAPVAMSAFWPWPVDAFHGQLYSGAFVAVAVGGWLVSRRAARPELFVQGASQAGFGLLAIKGLVLVDAATHRVNWLAWGTWVWIGGMGLVAGIGLALLLQWRRMR